MKHKRGDTFSLTGALKITEDGAVIDLEGLVIKSQVRTKFKNKLVDDLVVSLGSLTGTGIPINIYKVSTNHWPVEDLQVDVQIQFENGEVISSETIEFQCVMDVTQ